jgi:carboxyl-terminal processing protease
MLIKKLNDPRPMRFSRAFPRLICAIAAIGCVFAIARISSARVPDENALSAKDRTKILDDVWKNVRDRYYDPEFHGVDWASMRDKYLPLVQKAGTDEDFYAVLNRMTGELHDAHTRFNTPSQWQNRQKEQAFTIGFLMAEKDGKVVVNDVYPDSNAAHAGIEPGMIILKLNGQPITDRLAEAANSYPASSTDRITLTRTYARVFVGGPDVQFHLEFERADHSTFAVTLAKQTLSHPDDVQAKLLPSGNLYIRFDGFEEPVDREFKETLAKYKDAPGVIIDLRQNGGGRANIMTALTADFFNQKTVIAEFQTRGDISREESSGAEKGLRKMYTGGSGGQLYAGPVVILTDQYTGSSSEIFAGGLQQLGRAKVVGTQSCGCVIGIANNQKMKGGGVLEISEVLFFTPNGRKLEGDGVIPDVVVAPTIADLQQKRDAILEQGEKLLSDVRGGKVL